MTAHSKGDSVKNLLIILALLLGMIAAEPYIAAGFQDLADNSQAAKVTHAQVGRNPLQPFNPNRVATPQELSSHEVVFYYGDDHALCTATTIGPHALLTAAHCLEDASSLDEVTFMVDHVRMRYSIEKVLVDHRDHVVILTNGPAFTHIAPYVTRTPKMGEATYLYGFGQGIYPALRKVGSVINEYDPSEVDAYAGMFYMNTQIIPGDSGAAIYGADGKMLGLITYLVPGGFENKGLTETADFQLNFTSAQISEALTFAPKDLPKEIAKQLPAPSLAGKGAK